MISVWLVLLLLIAVYTLYRYKIKDVVIIDQMFPGPTALPLIGNALQALGNDQEIYKKIFMYSDYFNTTFRAWFAHKAYILINDPADAEIVLGSYATIDKAEEYNFFVPWIGYGLLTSTGEKWKKHRKLLTPAFHFKILDRFIEIFQANTDILCEMLSAQSGKGEIDIYDYIKLYALDNICETAMGTKINAQTYPQSAYVQAIKKISAAFFHRTLRLWYRSDFIFRASKHGAVVRESLKVLHGTTNEVIKKRKAELQTNKRVKIMTEDDDCYGKEKMAFLDILLLAAEENGLTDDDIRAEVDTFMFEGHDTITSGISFALFLLADHPAVQDKVLKEQLEIFGNDARSASYRDLQEMKYLEQVIKESLRLYPSVPVIGRKLNEDFPLRDGVYIPKGVQVVTLISGIHRSRRIWNNPNEFNPDNFTPEAIQKRHPYAYLPFSAGPRNCIGQRFAMLEMKCTLSKVIRRFEILPCLNAEDKPKLKTEMVLNSKNGVRLRVNLRTNEM